MVRRTGASANVEETNGPDMHTSRSIGDAGLVRPLAEMRHEGGGGMNLEQAISLLKPEKGNLHRIPEPGIRGYSWSQITPTSRRTTV